MPEFQILPDKAAYSCHEKPAEKGRTSPIIMAKNNSHQNEWIACYDNFPTFHTKLKQTMEPKLTASRDMATINRSAYFEIDKKGLAKT